MASKTVLKISEFEGKRFYLECFAYHVFMHSAVTFGARENCMQKWKCVEEEYARPDFIKVLSRMIFKYQITQRMTWCCLFYIRYFITKFNSLDDIQDALQIVLELAVKDADGCVFQEVLISLAVVSELVIYLYDISYNTYIKKLAFSWTAHFCGIRRKFEEAVGFTEMYKRLNQPKYDSLDIFYNEFIPKYCLKDDFYPGLHDRFYGDSKKFYQRIAKNLSVEEKREYKAVFSATIFRPARTVMEAKEILRLGLPANIKTIATYIHKWVPVSSQSFESTKIVPDGATSSQNLLSTSCQEMASERQRVLSTQAEGPKSSSSSSEEEFGHLNLGSSETEPGKLRNRYNVVVFGLNRFLQTYSTLRLECVAIDKKNKAFRNHLLYGWYGNAAVTEFRNHWAISSLIEEKGRRGSSSQVEGRKRKSSSISSEEGIKQLNLGPSTSERSSDSGNTEHNELTEEAIFANYKFFMDFLLRFDLHNRAEDPDDCVKFDEALKKYGLFVADRET